MKLYLLAINSLFLLLISCSGSKNQSPTVTGSEIRVFKLYGNNDPEVVSTQAGTGCACGPTLANHPSQTQGCTVYLVTEGNELIPSSENGSVIPFKNGATTCGVQECSLLQEKFAHNTACVPFYGFLDKVDENSLSLRQDSFIESIMKVQAPTNPLAVKRAVRAISGKAAPAFSGCGYKNQFSSINQCVAEQGKCMDTGWIYVTGCNYYCGGGAGWKACEKPPDFNVDLTPDSFNYGMLSSGGQLTWNVGTEIVKIPATVGDGLKQLASSGADCISMGYRAGSGPVLPACLTTVLVGGSIVVSIYYPPAVPYILRLGAGMSAWKIKNCVAPPNYNMEEALKYCQEAAADGATNLIPLAPIKNIATNLTSRLIKPPAEMDKYKKAWCAWGHTLERQRSGNPAKPAEYSTIRQRAEEIKTLQEKGYGKESEVEEILNQMGKYFSGDNTKYKLPTVGSSTGGHEMHVVLSNVKKEAEATGQLTRLLNGNQPEKKKVIGDLLKRLYNLEGQNPDVINDFIKNADAFFAAVQKINEARFRFKMVSDLPSACGPNKIKEHQKLVNKLLKGEDISSTGVEMDGFEGVTSFRWDFDKLKSVVFEIEKAESGVLGVVISGKDKVTAYGTQAQGVLGKPYVPFEKMIFLEKGYEFRVTKVTEVPMQLPDGKGNWITGRVPLVTVRVVKSDSPLTAGGLYTAHDSVYTAHEFINNFSFDDTTGQIVNINTPSSAGSCPVCEAPTNPDPNSDAADNKDGDPAANIDCGYEVYEAQYNPRTCETFWWKDPQPQFQCNDGCVGNFKNSGLPAIPNWNSGTLSACVPEPWNTEERLGCCEGMKQIKCVPKE